MVAGILLDPAPNPPQAVAQGPLGAPRNPWWCRAASLRVGEPPGVQEYAVRSAAEGPPPIANGSLCRCLERVYLRCGSSCAGPLAGSLAVPVPPAEDEFALLEVLACRCLRGLQCPTRQLGDPAGRSVRARRAPLGRPRAAPESARTGAPRQVPRRGLAVPVRSGTHAGQRRPCAGPPGQPGTLPRGPAPCPGSDCGEEPPKGAPAGAPGKAPGGGGCGGKGWRWVGG